LPYLDFDLDLFRRNLTQVNPRVTTIEVSARTGSGLDQWCSWVSTQAARPANQPSHAPDAMVAAEVGDRD
jgi:hydrogenase nickel incorporation protein HypB